MDESSIIWVDVESTGVDAYEDYLLEIAAAVTDMSGNVISDLIEFIIPPTENLGSIQNFTNKRVLDMHEQSGLWRDLWNAGAITMSEVDRELSDWVDRLGLSPSKTFFGGNSITLDREFVEYNLPEFYAHFSHRSIDVTSIALMLQGNFDLENFQKRLLHRAGSDVLESIEEYKFYLYYLRELKL